VLTNQIPDRDMEDNGAGQRRRKEREASSVARGRKKLKVVALLTPITS